MAKADSNRDIVRKPTVRAPELVVTPVSGRAAPAAMRSNRSSSSSYSSPSSSLTFDQEMTQAAAFSAGAGFGSSRPAAFFGSGGGASGLTGGSGRSGGSGLRSGRPPVVTSRNRNVVQDEVLSGKLIFTATDADGFVTHFRFMDAVGAGRFRLGNTTLKQGVWYTVTVAQLDSLVYVASNSFPKGKGTIQDRISIKALDNSKNWSAVKDISITSYQNANAPIVFGSSVELNEGFFLQVDTLFSIREEDRNTIKRYTVIDRSTAASSGYLELDGTRLAAGQWIDLTAAQFDRLRFYSGTGFVTDKIGLIAFDGRRKGTGNATVETLSRPGISGSEGVILDQLERRSIASLVNASGPGPQAVSYQFVDMTADAGIDLTGNFRDGFDFLDSGTVHTMSPADFATIDFQGGKFDQRSLDEIYVRLNNGVQWSQWEKVEVRTEPHHIDSLAVESWRNYILGDEIVITYSFLQAIPDYYPGDAAERADFWAPFTIDMANAARKALAKIQELINVHFEEVPDPVGGVIRFGTANLPPDPPDSPSAWAYFPADSDPINMGLGGDVWLNNDYLSPFSNFDEGGFWFFVLLHELGHAMGMKHPFEPYPVLPGATDTHQFSVMSYSGHASTNGNSRSMMVYDIAALQQIYGARTNTRTGNNTYSVVDDPDNPVIETIYDAGGIDTLSAENQTRRAIIDLRQGAYSSFGSQRDFFGNIIAAVDNVGIAFGVEIENATGSNFNDTIIGNELDNTLRGGAGIDTLSGLGGDDLLIGEDGNDIYRFGITDGNDRIQDTGTGTDRLDLMSRLPGAFGLDNLTQDVVFRRLGDDLYVDLRPNGQGSEGTVRIVGMGLADNSNRIESLRLYDSTDTQIGVTVDLTSIFSLADSDWRAFSLTANSSAFGRIAQIA